TEHLSDQAVHRVLVVQNIDDVLVVPPGDGQGHVHIVGGDVGLGPLLPLHQGPGQVGGVVLQSAPLLLVGSGQVGAGLPLQDIQGAAAAVQSQIAVVCLHDAQNGLRPVLV